MGTQMDRVAIAGAGLIGASIAWRLAQAGRAVTLFDAGTFGGEASSAGAGMLAPGGEFDQPSPWLDLGIEGLRLYPGFVEELESETGVAIDFRICGAVQLVGNETESEDLPRRAEFQARAGIRSQQIPEGLFYPGDGYVDPVDLLLALRSACETRGVRISERQPIHEIESGDFGAVVIAAGAWSSQIRVRCQNRPLNLPNTIPIKGHLAGFEMPPGSLGPIRRRGHTYVLERSSGFTIAGSTEEAVGFDRRVDAETCRDLHCRATEIYPALESLKPAKCWVGFRPKSGEGAGPQIGRVPGTNVWLAYGHYRNGILLTPLTAERVAREIVAAP